MLRWLWLSVAVVALDQLSKLAADHLLTLYAPRPVIPFFNLTLVYNQGAAFSFLSEAGGWQRWLFTLLAVAVSIFLIIWISKLRESERWTAASLALILGGAVGNLIDRVWHGYVIDFFDVYYGRYHWPAFNIADSAITVGAAILIFLGLFIRQSASK